MVSRQAVRKWGHRRMGVAVAAVAAAILVVVGVPRIPAVWSIVWGVGDFLSGGVEDRHKLLLDHPFPRTLAPSGYRLESVSPMFDGEETLGVAVSFAGPDDQDSISYYPHAMTADEVYGYWKNATVGFAKAGGTEPGFLPAENLGPRSYCAEDDLPLSSQHRVMCIAAFDGMAVIAESVNSNPERGSLEDAAALLHAGVEHWESIRD